MKQSTVKGLLITAIIILPGVILPITLGDDCSWILRVTLITIYIFFFVILGILSENKREVLKNTLMAMTIFAPIGLCTVFLSAKFGIWGVGIGVMSSIILTFLVLVIFSANKRNESKLALSILGFIICIPIGLIIIATVINESLTVIDNIKDTSIFSSINVTDRKIERQNEDNNRFKNDDEAINAVLYQYGVGSTIKGYTINTPTGYYQIGGSYNDSKRSFIVAFNLTDNRTGYVKGFVTKKNGKIKVKTDELILE